MAENSKRCLDGIVGQSTGKVNDAPLSGGEVEGVATLPQQPAGSVGPQGTRETTKCLHSRGQMSCRP
jgi:hypothetical protein